MGSMSASDAAPLPRLGEVFFDVRGSSRSMRLSWYSDTGVAVFSIWQGGTCTGTFRVPIDDLPRMVEALQRGPRGAALPADSRDLAGAPPHRALTGAATGPMPALASFPDYATGQDVPMTGESRAMTGDDGPPSIPNAAGGAESRPAGSYRPSPYGGDALGSGSYPVYRDRAPGPLAAPSGPPSYPGADSAAPPPSFQDDPLNAPYPGDPLGSGSYRQQQPRPSYRDPELSYGGDPLGSGSYPVYRDRGSGPLAAPSYPDRDSGAGSSFPGYADDGPPPSYRGADSAAPPPSFQDDPLNAPYPGDPLGCGSYRQQQPRPSYRGPEPSYGGDPLGSGSYPVYRDRAPEPPVGPPYPDRDSGAGSSFPGYADDGPPPSYRGADSAAPPPSFQDDPLNAPYPGDPLGSGSYRQQQPRPSYRGPEPSYGGDPLGSGSYPVYRDRAPGPLAAPSGPPSYPDKDSGAGSSFPGYADDGPPPSSRRPASPAPPPSFQDDPLNAPYPGDPLGSGSSR